MRFDEYMRGILGALGVGEDNGVPDPVWNQEEYLKAIYDAIKAGGGLLPPIASSDNGKLLGVVDGAYALVTIPPANGEDF